MTLDGLEKLLADSFPINRSKKNYYTPMINLVATRMILLSQERVRSCWRTMLNH